MSTPVKLFLTVVALILIFSGGVTFMLTTVPGLALLGFTWGVNLK